MGYCLINSTMYPNPDYWVSYIYKQLVGEEVLFPAMSDSTLLSTRLYAHCTAGHAGFPAGSVTIFGFNLADSISQSLHFNISQTCKIMNVYILTSDGPLTSQGVLLNGKRMDMQDDRTLPYLESVIHPINRGLILPPASLFYVVLPQADLKICNGQMRT